MNLKNIIIYNDLSTGYGTTLWHLQRDFKRLQELNIGFVNRGNPNLFGFFSHDALIRMLRNESAMEHFFRERLRDWLYLYERASGRYPTFILAVSCPWLQPLAVLKNRLRQQPALKNARFRIITVISPQDVLLEQRMRFANTEAGCRSWKNWLANSDLLNAGEFCKGVRKLFGAPNMVFVAGGANPLEMPYNPETEKNLYDMLNVPVSGFTNPLPSRLLLKSREARHVLSLYAMLNNAWPAEIKPLDVRLALENAEKNLADVLDFRSMMPSSEALEIRRDCDGGNRIAAAYFANQPFEEQIFSFTEDGHWQPYAGLGAEAAAAIVSELPDDLRSGMREALSVSRHILVPDQKVLLDALETKSFPHIIMRPDNSPKVSVLVQTCNQEAYVAQALDSVLEQKTVFPIEIIVVDDASTDDTRKVIEGYARRHANIRPVFLRGKARQGQNNRALLAHASAPYVALCDGDDYFIDENKLQMQAEYLDEHQDCSICFHPVLVRYEDGSPEHVYPTRNVVDECGGKFSLQTLLGANFIQTNSIMYRWRFVDGLPRWFDPTLVPGDWYWHLLHAEVGGIGFIDKPMSVYRRHRKSLFWRDNKASSVAHRLRFGIQELRLYEKILNHFGEPAQKPLFTLANGVFADLTRHFMETEDSAPLDKAIRYFPELGKHYLSSLQQLNDKDI